MRIRYQIAPGFELLKDWIINLPEYFPNNGQSIFKSRNEIKIFNTGKFQLNVKAFRVPNWINRFVYVYLRKSKAERSYKYARKLFSLDIPTPGAVGYAECVAWGLLRRSFYVSIHFQYDFTLREVLNYEIPDREEILRLWTRFTYHKLHMNNIYHHDYSPGNTLIRKSDKTYEFSIIDLNRMSFRKINFTLGIRNFRQLDTDGQTLQLLASEYAKLRGEDEIKASKILTIYDKKNKLSRQIRGSLKNRIQSIFKSGHDA